MLFDIQGPGDLAIQGVKAQYEAFLQTIPLFILVTTPLEEGTDAEQSLKRAVPHADVVRIMNKKDLNDDAGASSTEGCMAHFLLEVMSNLRTDPTAYVVDDGKTWAVVPENLPGHPPHFR